MKTLNNLDENIKYVTFIDFASTINTFALLKYLNIYLNWPNYTKICQLKLLYHLCKFLI